MCSKPLDPNLLRCLLDDRPDRPVAQTVAFRLAAFVTIRSNREARTAQNNRDYTIVNFATQENWKNDKGD